MELHITNKLPVPDYTTFHQLYAEHLDQSPSALVNSPTQESTTVLRDKVLDKPKLPSSAAKMFAVVDQWNAAQPISQLPLELITRIVAFGFPIRHSFEEVGEFSSSYYMKALASLAAISRTWRNATIGTPSFWGLLSTGLPPHTNRISLERSGTCPLTVGFISRPDSSNKTSVDELLDIALPHWNRWSHVRLGFILLVSPRIMEHLTSPAPRLETFYLGEDYHTAVDMEPIDLFGGYAPRLQDVWVYGAPIRWGSEVFRDLRSLKLDTLNKPLSADQLLAILSASPLLELLSMEDVGVGFTRDSPPSARTPIQLPHLKSITLYNIRVEAAGNILPFIRTPNCDSFKLHAITEFEDPFDATEFFDQTFGHFDAFVPSILAFHGSSQLDLLPDCMQWQCYAPGSYGSQFFDIEIPSQMNTSIPWIARFLGSEQLRPTHELNVTFKLQEPDGENLAGLETLSLLPNVQSFRMYYAEPWISVVLSLLGDPNKDARAETFPRLKEFRLDGTRGRPLQNLEAMLMRRYGESGQSVTGPPPIRIVLAPPFCGRLEGVSHTRLQFGDLCRIRTTHGVESVTLISPFGPEGMPACIYDDASGRYCNPL